MKTKRTVEYGTRGHIGYTDGITYRYITFAGTIHYYISNKEDWQQHRESGPSSIYRDGIMLYYINGQKMKYIGLFGEI